MVEYRTWEGDAREMAGFTRRVWSSVFRGRQTVPLWDAAFFDWELLTVPAIDRHLMVAAHEGDRIVGCLLSRPIRCRLFGRELDGALSSWLTVDPDYQRHGVARGIVAEKRRRMLERGCRFLLGFGLPGPGSKGIQFWASYRTETVLGRPVYWWGRPLDAAAIARNESTATRRLGARLLAMGGRSSGADGGLARPARDIRGYRPGDLAECLALVGSSGLTADLAHCWNAAELGHQLSREGVAATLVRVEGERVSGLLNYHRLDLLGRGELRAAVIDHFACGSRDVRAQRRLLAAGLVAMRASGAQLALASTASGAGRLVLLAAGFLPLWPGLRPIFFNLDPSLPFREVRRLHVRIR